MAKRKAFFGRCAARLCLDAIESRYLLEAFLGDGGHVVVGQIKHFAAGMGPAVRQLDRIIVFWIKHAIVSGITICHL